MKKMKFAKSYEDRQRGFVRSIFSTAGVILLLVLINLVTPSHHFWAKIPIVVLFGVLCLKALNLFGHHLANRIPSSTSTQYENDGFELRSIDYNQRSNNGRTWRDSDLV
jgi:hypothetical protein